MVSETIIFVFEYYFYNLLSKIYDKTIWIIGTIMLNINIYMRCDKCGVPQGPHLGPSPFFIIFIVDINREVNKVNCLLFADELKI